MKRFCKTLIVIAVVLCMCISLSGCSFYTYEQSTGRFAFGVSKTKKDVFCMSCEWSGGDMSFVIPDEFMGYKVTTLGGYTGRGVPSPFAVQIDLRELYPHDGEYGGYSACNEDYFDLNGDPDDEYDILTFNIHLGANLVNLNYIDGKKYYLKNIEKEDGSYDSDYLCKVVYYFTVDENNPKLYAQNGRLYYRSGDELITDFFYE